MAFSNGYLLVFFLLWVRTFTYGFNNSLIGSVLGLESFLIYFNITGENSKSNSIIGATSGLFAGGGAIGALLSAWLVNKVGRVRSIQTTCVICIISGAIQGGSVYIAMFLIGRLLSGMGVGFWSRSFQSIRVRFPPLKIEVAWWVAMDF
ncbi:uncharacterized protein N7483_005793 [Penicillium malachiteum]|uniref:uncharacterized protein n=1 Tax=Penicillium malachiteum TaxID=1324776 RepID=UPI002549349A|nr:uncharacterized protein N7483_005793 [Penicillium malachiteum]KAJ5731285.1 hypothetical protein N7483_005793 [Penicillium malachiteum]